VGNLQDLCNRALEVAAVTEISACDSRNHLRICRLWYSSKSHNRFL
jgi:hypothetical protein